MALLCNSFQACGHEVSLVTLDGIERDFYPLDGRIRRIGLNLLANGGEGSKVRANLRRISRLRSHFRMEQPDVLVSFITQANVIALIATAGLGIPVVISERTDPREHLEPLPWRVLRWCTYRRALRLVVQTNAVRTWAEGFMRKDRVIAIPNPVAPLADTVNEHRPATLQGLRIVAMGRLGHEKGFDLLLEAFALIAGRFPTARLVIYGEGPERGSLQRHAEALGLVDRVSFPGQVVRVADALSEASLFVLSSRYEGFPNVLLEAMSLSRPVIAFDCSSGPAEIVRHEIDGLLVPAADVKALSAAMARALSDPDLRMRISAKASEVNERFSLQSVLAAWQQVLEGTVRHEKR